MKTWILVLLCCGCSSTVVRETGTYKAEIEFMEQAMLQQSESILTLVKNSCQCQNGDLVDDDCKKAARRALVVKSRAKWHTKMMLYNAGVSNKKPGDLPLVPPTKSVCDVH